MIGSETQFYHSGSYFCMEMFDRTENGQQPIDPTVVDSNICTKIILEHVFVCVHVH